jgi:hypothetical protein
VTPTANDHRDNDKHFIPTASQHVGNLSTVWQRVSFPCNRITVKIRDAKNDWEKHGAVCDIEGMVKKECRHDERFKNFLVAQCRSAVFFAVDAVIYPMAIGIPKVTELLCRLVTSTKLNGKSVCRFGFFTHLIFPQGILLDDFILVRLKDFAAMRKMLLNSHSLRLAFRRRVDAVAKKPLFKLWRVNDVPRPDAIRPVDCQCPAWGFAFDVHAGWYL